MTGQIAFNEKSDIGRKLLNLINSTEEVTFKISKRTSKAEIEARKKKDEKFLRELADAMVEAEEMVKNGKKGLPAEKFKKTL